MTSPLSAVLVSGTDLVLKEHCDESFIGALCFLQSLGGAPFYQGGDTEQKNIIRTKDIDNKYD